jgi:hypothetical protein
VARIAGVNIPTNKRVHIALRYIHGIGPVNAVEICKKVGIAEERRVNQLSEAEVIQIREIIDREFIVEGDLRPHGPRLLSRPASPQGPADPRPAHAHQRPHPQGTGEGDRRQEAGYEVI